MSKNTFFNTRFWQDSYISDLDPSEKLLFAYCLTSPFLGLTGIYEAPLKHVAMETGLDKEMVSKIFARFSRDGRVVYLDGWVCLVNYPKYQSFKGEKLEVALKKEIMAVPKDILDFFIENGYPIDTLSIGSMDKERDKDMEEDKETKKVRSFKTDHALIVQVIDAFRVWNPAAKRWYKNNTQKEAVSDLVQEYGLEKVMKAVELLPTINQQNLYIAQVTTPYELQMNWVKLGNAMKRKTSSLKEKQPRVVW